MVTSAWTIQQLREAFPYDSAPRYLIFDRGTQFNGEVIGTIKDFGIKPKRTSYRSPWQNGVAERWVGNCRRDLLDHVIVLNERHLKRLMNEYVRYYHEDRTHLALAKETPAGRVTEENPGASSKVISVPRLGGLHHRYDLAPDESPLGFENFLRKQRENCARQSTVVPHPLRASLNKHAVPLKFLIQSPLDARQNLFENAFSRADRIVANHSPTRCCSNGRRSNRCWIRRRVPSA
jgi:hypothetical protein